MRFGVFFWALAFPCGGEEGEKTDFLRVHKEEESCYLQTSVTCYEKGEQKVSLLGAVHLADAAYYLDLNERFKKYDRLLYEMIGGEKMGEVQKNQPKPTGMAKMYGVLADFLKLTEQKKGINYAAENFVHADLTFTEFQKLQQERGESIFGFAAESAKQANPELQPKFKELMKALLSGDADAVKLQLIESLGAGDDQIGALAGKSVIITDRNERAMKVLAEQEKLGHRNLGIFYGAAHFPDLEKRLVERGFTKAKQEWLNAWTIQR